MIGFQLYFLHLMRWSSVLRSWRRSSISRDLLQIEKDSLVAGMRSIKQHIRKRDSMCFSVFWQRRRWALSYREESIRIVQKAFVNQQHVHSLSGQSQIEKKNRQIRQWAYRFRQKFFYFLQRSTHRNRSLDRLLKESHSFFGSFLAAEAVPYVGLDHWKNSFRQLGWNQKRLMYSRLHHSSFQIQIGSFLVPHHSIDWTAGYRHPLIDDK